MRESRPSRLARLAGFFGSRRQTLWALIGDLIALGLLGAIAVATRQPFVFPSLGPTAFLIFATPELNSATPRNAFCGHLIGVLCGWFALAVTGLLNAPPDVSTGISPERAVAAATALSLTSGFMVWLRVPHPPACATTLIIGLGVLHRPDQLLIMMVAIVLLLVEGVIMTRLAGIDYPLWSRKPATSSTTAGPGNSP